MTEYTVGKLYDPRRTSWPEQAEYNFRDGAHELRLFFNNVEARDIRNVKGPSEFALVEWGPVIFLLYQLGDMPWSDAPYSWHLVKEKIPEQATLPPALPGPESRVILDLMLVEATNGILKAMSAKSLSPEFTRELHAAIERQIATPFPGQKEYDAAIARCYREFPTPKHMMHQSSIRCKEGKNSL